MAGAKTRFEVGAAEAPPTRCPFSISAGSFMLSDMTKSLPATGGFCTGMMTMIERWACLTIVLLLPAPGGFCTGMMTMIEKWVCLTTVLFCQPQAAFYIVSVLLKCDQFICCLLHCELLTMAFAFVPPVPWPCQVCGQMVYFGSDDDSIWISRLCPRGYQFPYDRSSDDLDYHWQTTQSVSGAVMIWVTFCWRCYDRWYYRGVYQRGGA